MPLVVPTVGAMAILRWIAGQAEPVNLTIHLYANDHVPGEEDTLADYIELALDDYLAAATDPALWVVAPRYGGGATMTYPPVPFRMVGPGFVFGYFVTDASNTQLVWAELFLGGPYIAPAGPALVEVDPVFESQ
jgi:hypothetical protein